MTPDRGPASSTDTDQGSDPDPNGPYDALSSRGGGVQTKGDSISPALPPVEHGSISFQVLVGHMHGDEIARNQVHDLLEDFQVQHGKLADGYWPNHFQGAAALTEEPALYVCYGNLDAPIFDPVARAINDTRTISIRALRLLSGRDLRTCLELLFFEVTEAIDLLDETARRENAGQAELSTEFVSKALARIETERVDTEAYLEASAERRAQFMYFQGMIGGLAACMVLAVLARATEAAGLVPITLAGPFIAGALGSVVSVLARMTRSQLRLDYEAGASMLRLLGAVRPFVGAVFACALLLLVEGGLLPIQLPLEANSRVAFVLGLGFLAGFSERWAQDMLSLGRGTLAT
jgi:hypothetical protein